MSGKRSKKQFIPNIWVCGLDAEMNEIIGRTVYVNGKEMIHFVGENGTLGVIGYSEVFNLYKIVPDFKKDRFMTARAKKETQFKDALEELLKEMKIGLRKN